MDAEHGRGGRPRSEAARTAVLHAVDDLLLEVGYTAMTMKGIAERAGVSRQTVYRWWSTKAEILFEASAFDAEQELATEAPGPPLEALTTYLATLIRFLTASPAGAAYRALLGQAQHDAPVAELLLSKDILGDSARLVIARTLGSEVLAIPMDRATALLIGPTFYWILCGRDPARLAPRDLAADFLAAVGARG